MANKGEILFFPATYLFSSVQSLSRVRLFVTRGQQHARPPCPSPTPGVYPNPCLLSQWCHPIISSSVVPVFSCPQSFPGSKSFSVSWLQYKLLELLHQSLQWIFRVDFLSDCHLGLWLSHGQIQKETEEDIHYLNGKKETVLQALWLKENLLVRYISTPVTSIFLSLKCVYKVIYLNELLSEFHKVVHVELFT